MIQNNSISPVNFGNNKKQGLGSAVGGSLISTGAKIATGAAIGAAGGKVASMLPYTPSQELLNAQYSDMFEKAVSAAKNPEYLVKSKTAAAVDIVDKARDAIKTLGECGTAKQKADIMGTIIANASDSELASGEIQTKIKELLAEITKLSKDSTPVDTLNKEALLGKLRTSSDTLGQKIEEAKTGAVGLREKFVECVQNAKDKAIDEVAIKGAKDYKKSSIIGIGIAAGVIGMLVWNLVKTYTGGKKGAKAPQETQNK